MGGRGWLMTTTVMNVMLMGDDDVDDVADFFLFLTLGDFCRSVCRCPHSALCAPPRPAFVHGLLQPWATTIRLAPMQHWAATRKAWARARAHPCISHHLNVRM